MELQTNKNAETKDQHQELNHSLIKIVTEGREIAKRLKGVVKATTHLKKKLEDGHADHEDKWQLERMSQWTESSSQKLKAIRREYEEKINVLLVKDPNGKFMKTVTHQDTQTLLEEFKI